MTMEQILHWIKNIDHTLLSFVEEYGEATYIFLFIIIFLKTAIIVLVFLPADTALFTAGAIAAMSNLNFWFLLPLIILAAFLGDQSNFLLGKLFGFARNHSRLLQKILPTSMLEKSSYYLKQYGKMAIIFSRFIPVIRGTLPFVCASSKYPYIKFSLLNLVSCVIWTSTWLISGYLLGSIPFIQNNLVASLLLLSIIFASPALFQRIYKTGFQRLLGKT